jgi:hypothetical protein
MLRLLEMSYEGLVAMVSERYPKGPFLARAPYGVF